MTPKRIIMAIRAKNLILASASPRRRELLRWLGIPFRVLPGNAQEDIIDGREPEVLAQELAYKKALAAAPKVQRGLILGADTMVISGPEILGKPADIEQAYLMLKKLSGKKHRVVTGLSLLEVPGGHHREAAVVSEVAFRFLRDEEIWEYIRTGEPLDKAGAYAIQGRGGALIAGISGCYTNIIGLPVPKLLEMLKGFGFEY
jgi:septum formation protein